MKKLLAVMSAIMMLLCGMTVFAENESLDMDHDTAVVYLDDVEHKFALDSVTDNAEDPGIVAIYTSVDSDDLLFIVVNRDLKTGEYYDAANVEDDVFAVLYATEDGEIFTTVCSETSLAEGNSSNMAVAAFDEDGWYQFAAAGVIASDDYSVSYEIVMACDFMFSGEAAVAEEPAAEEAVVEAAGTEAADDEEYFFPNIAQLNVDGTYYEMTLSTTELDDGIYAMYSMEGANNMFALGIDTGLEAGVYTCDEADGELVYCAFIDDDGTVYYGGCSNNTGDTFGKCDAVVVTADDNGLYQIAIIGQVIDEVSGEALEIAGFADFTME